MSSEEVLDLMANGDLTVLGLLPYSSNYTFLARIDGDGDPLLAVYKPRRGERPLWDFPRGTLASREVGAWLVGEAAGWGFVPPTVLRDDAPLGAGSLQLFIEHDPDRHYFVLMEERLDDFASLAAFDVVINNADRKAGHVIEDAASKLWAVDHGLSFHVEPKLRTVIWQFASEPLGEELRVALERLHTSFAAGELHKQLGSLLSEAEADATLARLESLLMAGTFPAPGPDRPLPWPLI